MALMIRNQCQIANRKLIDRCYIIVIPSTKDISRLASENTRITKIDRYVCYTSIRRSIERYKY